MVKAVASGLFDVRICGSRSKGSEFGLSDTAAERKSICSQVGKQRNFRESSVQINAQYGKGWES